MPEHPPYLSDTIAALSTPPGRSGVGVIRMSGPDSVGILARIFAPARDGNDFPDRRAVYGTVKDPQHNTVLDDGIALVMRGPGSYTGEDVVELFLHGSPVALNLVLDLLAGLGARPAHRGEFTRRAFLAGKLDIVQAESVLDVIEARSPSALYEARDRLTRGLSLGVHEVSTAIKDAIATIEAHLDFDEEEEEPRPSILPEVRGILGGLDDLLRAAESARMRRDGIKVALAGKPNVGKSTLFNTLLRRDRAIVTPYPGTTRDPLEESVVIGDMEFLLCDTAGIREDPEPIEAEGIRRTRIQVEDADVVLAILDGSLPPDREDEAVLNFLLNRPGVVVLNKADLGTVACSLPEDLQTRGPTCLSVSAKTGDRIDELEATLGALGRSLAATDEDHSSAAFNHRCRVLLVQCADVMRELHGMLERSPRGNPEIVSLTLRRALEPLEELTGERIDEGILERIFERFCVGK